MLASFPYILIERNITSQSNANNSIDLLATNFLSLYAALDIQAFNMFIDLAVQWLSPLVGPIQIHYLIDQHLYRFV